MFLSFSLGNFTNINFVEWSKSSERQGFKFAHINCEN